ncbi:sacsin N-terminal ATP-binding-like domain-containing protein [Ancylobacter mangrovi]|uniref:sacsin N-terminal ATP-binding-like domain-containing protein n=1 Tax=Ancylobacter mangrovi TaxID=2972472 RepID=UPI0021619B14|nr:DUF3883 domain-containing protein [Ancylobacter mangrovi]MCS0505140.1 DUF3883 domain-containing protein [Ancylobacter mangrovi]
MDGVEHPITQSMAVAETPPDGLEALTVSQLENALDAAKRGLGVYQSLSNLNDVIGAEYGDRVIYELLQNAHDAHDRNRTDGEVVIRLIVRGAEEGDLFVANRGRGFRSADLNAIRNIATSSKEIGEGIGNKGLGFRSVEALTEDVHIWSRATDGAGPVFDGYCFRFARRPEIEAMLEALGAGSEMASQVAANIPRYLLPVPPEAQPPEITAFAEQGFATVVRLPLTTADAVNLARDQVQKLDSQQAPLLLFLRRLGSVTIDISQPRGSGRSTTRTLRRNSSGSTPVPDILGAEIETVDLDRAGRFIVIRRAIAKDALLNAVRASIGQAPQLKRWLDWRGEPGVSVAVALTGEPVGQPRLYNFLPMDEKAVAPLAGFADAPFFTDIDRRDLKLDLPLNAHLMGELGESCVAVALAAVAKKIDAPSTAITDLLAWQPASRTPLSNALQRRNSSIRTVVAWPTETGAQNAWTSLFRGVDWSEQKLRLINPANLAAAGAPILDSRLGAARLRRVRALADAVGDNLKPGGADLAGWLETLAATRRAEGPRKVKDWPAFYDEIVGLHQRLGLPLTALRGRLILLGTQGDLLEAIGSAKGGKCPTYIRSQSTKRGRLAPPLPPSSLSRKLRFMAEHATPSDATLHAFQTADLVRRYDPVEVLAELPTTLGSTPTAAQRRDALIWAFRVARRGAHGLDEALKAARLYVPARTGWRPAAECAFSEAWTSRGQALERYLTEAAAVSRDAERALDFLLAPWAEWPKAEPDQTLTDWRRFLDKLEVRDGLRPIAAAIPESGTPNWVWSSIVKNGAPTEGLGKAWLAATNGTYFLFPQTNYVRRGEAWRIPGQLEHAQLSDAARERLSDLIVAYLRDVGDRDFAFHVGAYHKDRDQDVTSIPTPLQAFLKTEPWIAVTRDDELVFRRPDRCWAARTGRQPSRFVDRYVADTTSGVPAIMFDDRVGLCDWSDPEKITRRLADIAVAVEGISSSDRRDFREIYRRLWSEFLETGLPLGDSPIIVERSGVLQRLADDRTAPPTVYVASEGGAFAARMLADHGEAVLDLGAGTDEAAAIKRLNDTGRFAAKPTSSGVVLHVDGAPFTPVASAPLLIGQPGLEWLPDVAALAYQALGDPLEIRNVSSQNIERRARAIRLRQCESISLVVGDTGTPLGRHDGAQAVPHASWPTLLVKGDRTIDWGWLLQTAPAISKLLGSGVKSLEIVLHRLARPGELPAAPSVERLAAALERGVDFVREHFDAAEGGLTRRVSAVLPVVQYVGGEALVEDLRIEAERRGSRFDLVGWLDAHLDGLEGAAVLTACRNLHNLLDVQVRLGLDFGRFNRALRALGRPGLNDRSDMERMFEVYLNELRPRLVEQLRCRWRSAWLAHEPLNSYLAQKSLAFIAFDPVWVDQFPVLERDHVVGHAAARLREEVGEIPAEIVPALDDVLFANRKLLAKRLPELGAMIGAWRALNGAKADDDWSQGDPAQAARRLEQAGVLDFEIIASGDIPAILNRHGLWPSDMQVADDLQVLGLTSEQLTAHKAKAEEARRKQEIDKRSIRFGAHTVDPESAEFHRSLADAVLVGLRNSPDWYARSGAVRLKQQVQPEPRTPGTGGPGGKRREKAPPESLRNAMGLASELLVREYLRLRFPNEMSDECWVSSSREAYCPDKEGNDRLGFDFRVVTSRHEWLFEVKSALDDGGEFEFTANELAVAGSAALDRKRRYRILYVTNVFNPALWRILELGNPANETWRDRYRIVRRGATRYAFDVRAQR